MKALEDLKACFEETGPKFTVPEILERIAEIERVLADQQRSMSKEATNLALKALREIEALPGVSSANLYARHAIKAIEALADQPAQQEPVSFDVELWLGQPSYHDGFGRSPDLWSLAQIKSAVASMLAAAPKPAQQDPVAGKGKELSEQLKLCARNAVFVAAGRVDMSSAAMQEMFALIDHVCIGIDSPQPAQQEPVALLPEVDVCMRAEAHGIDSNTKGLYGFYVDCVSASPPQRKPIGYAGITIWSGDVTVGKGFTETEMKFVDQGPRILIERVVSQLLDELAAHGINE